MNETEKLSSIVQFRLDKKVHYLMELAARSKHMSKSDYIRYAIEEGLKKVDSGNQHKAKEYLRDMFEHDYPLLAQEHQQLREKYQTLLAFIKNLTIIDQLETIRNVIWQEGLAIRANALLKEIGEFND